MNGARTSKARFASAPPLLIFASLTDSIGVPSFSISRGIRPWFRRHRPALGLQGLLFRGKLYAAK